MELHQTHTEMLEDAKDQTEILPGLTKSLRYREGGDP